MSTTISTEIKAFDHTFIVEAGVLAQLTGSEKQISWACDIRCQVVCQLLALETELAHPEVFAPQKGIDAAKALKLAKVFRAFIEEQTSAKFFIDYLNGTNGKDLNAVMAALFAAGHKAALAARLSA